MKPEEIVRRTIRESDLSVNECVDRAILDDARRCLRTVTRKQSVAWQPAIWRLIMKNPATKLMSVCTICVVIMIYCLSDSLNSTSVAFAEVKQAVENMPLVHRILDTYRDGKHYHSENWYAFDTRTVVSKWSVDGQCFKISTLNYDTMENHVYDPNTGIVKKFYRTDVNTNLLSDSPWTMVEEYLQGFEQKKASVDHKQGVYDNNDVSIHHFLIPRNSRYEKVEGELFVHHESQLPLIYKQKFWTQQGDLKVDQVIHFHFPPNGPNDIYDLGVPQSAQIVYDSNSKALLALKEKLSKDKRAYEKAFTKEQKKNKAYHLGDGQVLKHIDPSLIRPRARIDWANDMLRHLGSQAGSDASIQREFIRTDRYLAFRWDERLIKKGASVFKEGVSLHEAFERIVGLSKSEYQIPGTLLDIKIKGDWVVRKGATKTQLLKAFEEIVQKQMRRPIRFQKQIVERDVIVASGTFRFKPLPKSYDNEWIHVFSDDMDPDERGGGGSGTLDRFLCSLGDVPLNQQVLNETDAFRDIKVMWGWHYSGYLRKVNDDAEKQKKLTMLLDNLSQQTGLQFKQEQRNVIVWTVTEQAG